MSRYYDADGADRRITTINQYLDVYPDVDDFGVPYEDANVDDGKPSGALVTPSSPTPTPDASETPAPPPRAEAPGSASHPHVSGPAGVNGRSA